MPPAMTLARREDLLRDQHTHPPFGSRRLTTAPVRLGVTGSGPSLLLLAWSPSDLARERRAGGRVLARLGVEPGMRVANTLAGALATPGSLLLGDVVEELGGLDVPLGEVTSETAARQAWELVDRVQPEVLVLDADTAGRFLAAAPAAARPWWRGIVRLACGAPGPALALPVTAGFAGWQRTWLAVPEVTSFVAGECPRRLLHVDEGLDAIVADAATGAPQPAGHAGLLVLALREVEPALRYASGLRARVVPEECTCGAPGTIVEVGG